MRLHSITHLDFQPHTGLGGYNEQVMCSDSSGAHRLDQPAGSKASCWHLVTASLVKLHVQLVCASVF